MLALIPIWLYNGRQGPHNRLVQYACYAFYPLHILVLAVLCCTCFKREAFQWRSRSQEKTNVMRILDQKKIPYTAHFYDESQGPEGTREYGVHVAAALGQDPARGFKTLAGPGRVQRNLYLRGAGGGELGFEKGGQGGGREVHRAFARE